MTPRLWKLVDCGILAAAWPLFRGPPGDESKVGSTAIRPVFEVGGISPQRRTAGLVVSEASSSRDRGRRRWRGPAAFAILPRRPATSGREAPS